MPFDYQSNRHCAKTPTAVNSDATCLITSQIDTVPKLGKRSKKLSGGLITSQIDTVPKPSRELYPLYTGLITSQIDTVPKHPGGLF